MESSNGRHDLFKMNPNIPKNLAYCLEYPMSENSGAAFSDDHYGGFFNPGIQNYIQSTIDFNSASHYNFSYVSHNLAGYTLMHDLLQIPKNRFPLPRKDKIRIAYAKNSNRKYYCLSGVLVCRPYLKGNRQIAATFKLLGGVKNSSYGGHNHNDAGSYSIMLNGVKIAGELGGPRFYEFDHWDISHYNFNITNSYGHPVPVVGGKLQVGNWIYSYTSSEMLKVISTSFKDDEDVITYDLTKAYDVSSLLSLTRENIFKRANGLQSVSIIDEAIFTNETSFEVAITSLGNWTTILKKTNELHGRLTLKNTTIVVTVQSYNAFEMKIETQTNCGTSFTRVGILISKPSKYERVKVIYT